MHVPHEILLYIASYFGLNELYCSSLVSGEWKVMIYQEERLWEALISNCGLAPYLALLTPPRVLRTKPQWSSILYKYACYECRAFGAGLVAVEAFGLQACKSALLPFCIPCSKMVSRVHTWKERIRLSLPRSKRRLPEHVFSSLVNKFPYPCQAAPGRKRRRKEKEEPVEEVTEAAEAAEVEEVPVVVVKKKRGPYKVKRKVVPTRVIYNMYQM